jgi:hypothetical protein
MKKDRELFYAKLENGDKVLVDKLQKGDSRKFLCPHCNGEVVAKLGDKKIKHFAHKGQVCEFLRKPVETPNKSLGDYSEKTVSIDEYKFTKDETIFECKICKKSMNKSIGLKWKGEDWVCKNCFSKL